MKELQRLLSIFNAMNSYRESSFLQSQPKQGCGCIVIFDVQYRTLISTRAVLAPMTELASRSQSEFECVRRAMEKNRCFRKCDRSPPAKCSSCAMRQTLKRNRLETCEP